MKFMPSSALSLVRTGLLALAAVTGTQRAAGQTNPSRPSQAPAGERRDVGSQPQQALASNPHPEGQPAQAPPPLTPEQQRRLAEGFSQAQRAQALAQQRKYPEAIAATQSWLDALREVHGAGSLQTTDALELLARLHATNHDFGPEIQTRREKLELQRKALGENDWRVTDSRLLLANRQRVAAMAPTEKQRLGEAVEAFNAGLTRFQNKQFDAAIEPLARARQLLSDLMGVNDRDLAVCDSLQALIQMERSNYAQARLYWEQAVRLRRGTLGDNHPETIEALTRLSHVAEVQGNFIEAKVILEQALLHRPRIIQQQQTWQVSVVGPGHTISHRPREIQQAEARAVEIMENLGRLLLFLGDEVGARNRLEEAAGLGQFLAMEQSAISGGFRRFTGLGAPGQTGPTSSTRKRPGPFGAGDPTLHTFGLHNPGFSSRGIPWGYLGVPGGIGGYLGGLGAGGELGFGDIRLDGQDEYAMLDQPAHPWSLRTRAKYMLYLQAINRRQREGEAEFVTAAYFSASQGQSFIRTSDGERFRGESWIAYARILGRLAGILQDQGRLNEARLLRLCSLRIGLEATDPSEGTASQYVDFVDQFIDFLQDQDEFELCQILAHEMVRLRRDLFGPKHLIFASALEKLAQVLWARGDHAQATLMLEKAIAIRQAGGDASRRELNDLRYRLALLQRDRGEIAEARQIMVKALDEHESYVFATVPFLPDRERLAMMARFSRSVAAYLDFSGGCPGEVEEDYRRLLTWKGTATDVATAQRASVATAELRALSEELSQVLDDLNRMYYTGVPVDQAETHSRRLRDRLERRTALESQLARSIGWSRPSISIAEVISALPTRSALVDLFRYMRYVPATEKEVQARNQAPFISRFEARPAEGPKLHFEAHYVAFVIRPDHGLVRVDLGRAEPIDEAVMALLDEIENNRDFDAPALRLSHAVWEPLVAHLREADWIMVAPDGAMSFIPWGALPGQTPGSCLLEECGFGLVTSARQLIRSIPDRASRLDRSLLVVGGVDYDRAGPNDPQTPASPQPEKMILASASTRAGAFAGDRLEVAPLPGTRDESDQVSRLFSDMGPGRSGEGATRVSGAQATKPHIRSAMVQKAYLHLATHGYFAPPKFASALSPGMLKVAPRSNSGNDRTELHGLYPGLLSGLIWAGANRPDPDPLTGGLDLGGRIMTAEEVAGVDLQACELAVLSACETGRGQVAGGEGVLGLQRAFHEAGARRVVASLWKVDDKATLALMSRFYTFLWRDGLDPMQALRAAQLELMRGEIEPAESRALGTPEASQAARSGRRTHPRLWAAWVISGRPEGSLPGSLNGLRSPQRTQALFHGVERRRMAVGATALVVISSVVTVAWLRSRRRRLRSDHMNGSVIVGSGESE
jgi:CHAT domain-containing protein/tetratricopeptide (TPR) repeat protein